MCTFLIFVVTRQTSHLRICFSFSNNDPVTLCMIDRMGARVSSIFTTRYMLLMWGLLCVVSKHIVCCVSINFSKYKPDLFFTWHGGLCVYFLVIVVTHLTSHFGLCLFFFQQTISLFFVWYGGGLCLKDILCDMMGACVYKFFTGQFYIQTSFMLW